MVSQMSQNDQGKEGYTQRTLDQEEESSSLPSFSRKRSLLDGQEIRFNNSNKKKKRRTVILIDDIKAVAPPESSEKSDYATRLKNVWEPNMGREDSRIGSDNAIEESQVKVVKDLSISPPEVVTPLTEQNNSQRKNPRDGDEWTVKRGEEDLARLEEKQIMEMLHRDICRQEEREIMQYLLKIVYEAEDLDYAKSLPCLVKQEYGDYEWERKYQTSGHKSVSTGSIPDSWNLCKRKRKRSRLYRSSSVMNNGLIPLENTTSDKLHVVDETSKAMEVLEVNCETVRFSLPKWITPPEPTTHQERLFSHPEFVRHVIKETELELPFEIRTNSCLWKFTFSENHPEEGLKSSWLEALIPVQYLEVLRKKVLDFVRGCIFRYNRQTLLADGESNLVDVSLSLISSGSLGLTLARHQMVETHDSGPGIWVSRAAPESVFCQLLGGSTAYGGGCVLLAVNDKKVFSTAEAVELINRTKLNEEHRHKMGMAPTSNVTVCVSRYAEFSKSSNPSALTIRSVSSSLVDLENVGESRLAKYLEESGKPPPCWVEVDDEDMAHWSNVQVLGASSHNDLISPYQQIISDKQSVEIDLVLSAKGGDIGANIDEIAGTGLYIRQISSKSELGKILGESACQCGSILWKVNGKQVKTKAELDESIVSVGLSCYTLSLLMFNGTDLSDVDKEKLVRGKINPRRQNGQPYALSRRLSGTKSNGKVAKERLPDDDNGGGRANAFDSNGDDVLPSKEDQVRSENRSVRKFKKLVRLEYKDFGVSHVFASLWAKHQQMFGETASCDANCQCIFFIPELCDNVLDDYIDRQRRNNIPIEARSVLRTRIPGIMHFFAPRFVLKLREMYINETPDQIVDRICDMWGVHTHARQYGGSCSASCLCEEEWNHLFGQGDVNDAEKSSTSSTTTQKGVSHIGLLSSNQTSQREHSDLANVDVEANSLYSATLPLPAPRRMSQLQTPKRTVVLQGTTYEVAFDSSLPLGGYFITSNGPNGMTLVEVHSVFPFGQMAKDRRIVPGTCVEAVLAGERRNVVATHSDLKRRYEVARRHRRPLKLILISQASPPDQNQDQDSWSRRGDWSGRSVDGWAGGAIDHTLRGSTPHADDAAERPWTIKVHERLIPLPSQKPTKPSLKLNIASSQPKKVSFSRVYETKIIFDKEYPSNTEVVRQSTQENVDRVLEPASVSKEQRLADVIQRGTFKDVVELLQSDFSVDAYQINTVLKFHYRHLKWERGQLHGNSTPEATLKKTELEAKCAALKLYINCAYQIAKAMSLTKWYKLQIRVVEVTMAKVNKSAGKSVGSRTVQVSTRHGNEEKSREILGTLTSKSLSERMTFEADGASTFAVRNNATFGLEDRELVIEVNDGVAHGTTPESTIASVTFKFDELEGRCRVDGTWVDAVQTLHSDSSTFSGGEVRISVMKQRAGSDYVAQKRAEILHTLKGLVENVKKYNNDPTRPIDEKILVHFKGINGLSVLHAAIHLGESGHLISAMLDLGADPKLKSQLGTPLHFAQQQLDRSLEKEKNLEAKKASVEELHRQREKCELVKALVKKLQTAGVSSQNENGRASVNIPGVPTTSDGGQDNEDGISRSDSVVACTPDHIKGDSSRVLSRKEDCRKTSACENSEGGRASEGTSGGFMASIPSRRPSLSLSSSVLDDSYADVDNDQRHSFLPRLPHLPSVEWAPLLHTGNQRCAYNFKGCFHLRSMSCRFWHDIFSPLRDEEMKLVPRSIKLSPNLVSLKEEGHLWTAAFADQSTKRFIHVQDVLQEGHTSSQGISWFISREAAEAALERTVSILREVEVSSPQNHDQNFGEKGTTGRKKKRRGRSSQKFSSSET